MPNKEGEYTWEAVIRAIDPHTLPAVKAGKIAAAWKFHQFVLHATDHHITDEKLKRMEEETFSLLSKAEKHVLDEAHHFLIPHSY